MFYMENQTPKESSLFSTLAELIGVSFALQVYKFIPLFSFDDLALLIHLLKTFITLSRVLTFDPICHRAITTSPYDDGFPFEFY